MKLSDEDMEKLRDMLGEISKESYIAGAKTEQELENKYNK